MNTFKWLKRTITSLAWGFDGPPEGTAGRPDGRLDRRPDGRTKVILMPCMAPNDQLSWSARARFYNDCFIISILVKEFR